MTHFPTTEIYTIPQSSAASDVYKRQAVRFTLQAYLVYVSRVHRDAVAAAAHLPEDGTALGQECGYIQSNEAHHPVESRSYAKNCTWRLLGYIFSLEGAGKCLRGRGDLHGIGCGRANNRIYHSKPGDTNTSEMQLKQCNSRTEKMSERIPVPNS